MARSGVACAGESGATRAGEHDPTRQRDLCAIEQAGVVVDHHHNLQGRSRLAFDRLDRFDQLRPSRVEGGADHDAEGEISTGLCDRSPPSTRRQESYSQEAR